MYLQDTSTLPLVIIQIAGALTDEDLEKMEEARRWSQRVATPYVAITLARFSDRPSSDKRKRIAEITGAGKGNSNLLANGIVVANELVAGALTAIRWLAPAQRPEKVFTDAAAALQWLQPQAEAAGLVIPAHARERALHMDVTRPG